MQESVSVQEGGCTIVSCSFPSTWKSSYPSSKIYISWYQNQYNPYNLAPVATNDPETQVNRETKSRFFLMDPTANNCSLSIRDARKTDAGTYVLRVQRQNTYHNYYQEKKLTLQVTDLTQKPDIHIRGPLESGCSTQLSCSLPGSCEGGRPLRFSWVGDALDSLNPNALRSSALTFTPKPSDDGTKVTCRVTLAGSRVTTQKTIWLNVSYPPQLLGPSCSWEDEGLRCSCSSRAQPAPSLRWRLGEGLLEGNPSNASYTVTSSSAGPWANSSLSLRAGLSTGLRLSCEAENVHGAQSASVLLLPGQAACECRAVPGALGGAGAMVLLSLCLCVISFCIVKAHRKRTARGRKVTNDEDPVMGMVTWGSQQNPDRPPDQLSPMEDASPSGEEQDTPYANLRFHRGEPCEAQDKEAASTCVYSEIKKTSK
ncbi:sialic acid-binding Ig-like lectin 5 [Glossophaga mutica]